MTRPQLDMEDQMNKAEVLEAMQTERSNLESLLTALSDEQMCLPAVDVVAIRSSAVVGVLSYRYC